MINIGIINVSDRASKGIYEDIPGKAIVEVLTRYIKSSWKPVYKVLPDEVELLTTEFYRMAREENCCLILTCGGTGPAKRDVTVEATKAVCTKMLPGFGEQMRRVSLASVPTAILSRQTAGIFDNTLIVNLPGKPSAIEECLKAVFPAIPYCIDLIEGPFIEANEAHIAVFRPKNAHK